MNGSIEELERVAMHKAGFHACCICHRMHPGQWGSICKECETKEAQVIRPTPG